MKPHVLVLAALTSALGAATACRTDLDDPAPAIALDEAWFRCRVQPVLAKSCAMNACHGDGRRYFRVFARNRLRLAIPSEIQRNAPLTDAERRANFDAAAALVDANDPDESMLLKKPLSPALGGYYHRGAELFGGGDVWTEASDPDLAAVRDWIHGRKEDPACVEPGSQL